MKRYIKSNTTTLAFPITGRFVTKRGKEYYYEIYSTGRVEAREQYTEHKSTGGYRIRERYLYKVPKEMQDYLINEYGSALTEMGVSLYF